MNRLARAYQERFRDRLALFHPRQPDKALALLFAQSRRLSETSGISLCRAMVHVDVRLRRKASLWGERVSSRRPTPLTMARWGDEPPRFLCNGGLGGLARWLRASGYDAEWFPGSEDSVLVERTAASDGILLTTDSLMLERRVLREGTVPALWLAPCLSILEQLEFVLGEFRLPLREPRCMSCGGALRTVPKDEVRPQIPPKTLFWCDEYFHCTRCGKLFWRGTHWTRVRRHLQRISTNGTIQFQG